MTRAYYNEIDPYAAEWLRNLIAAGLITAGDVDTRSIVDVRPSDLEGYERCHFFAGIGVWGLSLRLADWPPGRPVWTGSCPCQPFSAAGRRAGFGDARHLWPIWFDLIRQCRPSAVLGEQVAGPDGSIWLAAVRSDLEREDYAFGAADLPAAGGGAPHPRQRHFFMGRCGRSDADSGAGYGRHRDVQVGREQNASAALPALLSFRSERAAEPRPAALDHGPSARVGRCRAYGNAIDPRIAALFIGACLS